jgi:hypothetical protein
MWGTVRKRRKNVVSRERLRSSSTTMRTGWAGGDPASAGSMGSLDGYTPVSRRLYE